MEKIKKQFVDSFHELRDVKSLAAAAMLLAATIVLGFFLRLQLTESLRIGFDYIAKELTGMFFGPVVGCVVGGLSDIISFMIKPTGPYFPGFTICAMLAGIIYGIILYKKPLSLKRIIVANSLVTVFVNLLLNTYWVSMLYGNAFIALLPARLIKQIIMLPIEIIVFYIVAKVLTRANVLAMIREKA